MTQIHYELTPNPSTVKFLPGQMVMENGNRDFASPEDAEISPLAKTLFALGDVTGVFFGADFISVTAAPGVDWATLRPEVLFILGDHFAANMPLFNPGSAGDIHVGGEEEGEWPVDPEDEDIVVQIKELIATRIRPAVAADGGDVLFRGFDKGIVYLLMQGACAGCPSASATLKHGIENLLKHYVPEVIEVRAA